MTSSSVDYLVKSQPEDLISSVSVTPGTNHNQEKKWVFLELEKLQEEINSIVLYVHQLHCCFLTSLPHFLQRLHRHVCHLHSQT